MCATVLFCQISNLKSDQNKELQEREQSHKDQVKQLVSEHEHNLAGTAAHITVGGTSAGMGLH